MRKEEGWKFHIAHEGRIQENCYGRMPCFYKKVPKDGISPADSKHLLDYVRDRGAVTFETLLARHFLENGTEPMELVKSGI